MAHSQEAWAEAKFLWELDKPLDYIAEKTGISKGQISKKSTAKNWKKETKGNALKPAIKEFEKKKETLEVEKETIIKDMVSLEDYQIKLLDKVIEEETGIKSILFSTAALSLIRKNKLLEKNTKTVLAKTKHYDDTGKLQMETMEPVDIELGPTDLKTIDEGIDKNAITLGQAPRHASSPQVAIQNNNTANAGIKTFSELYGNTES